MALDMYKQVIVIRHDLGMRKGKIAAQAAHASLGALLENAVKIEASQQRYYAIPYQQAVEEWFEEGCTKICVYVKSEQELRAIYAQAYNAGLRCSLIKDKGLTEFKEPTFTAVGIGPNFNGEIDKITKDLPLL